MEAGSLVGVVGAGTMGSGIAQVAAAAGFRVILCDAADAALTRARERINDSLQRLVRKQQLSAEDASATLARIAFSTDLQQLATARAIVEAVVEELSVKSALWKRIDALCPQDAVLASNTSSISITLLAQNVRRPERFIGLHFFNPVPVMKLIELIRGQRTDAATLTAAREWAVQLGKTAIEVNDFPGFVSNRVLMPLLNEAMFAVYEGVATPQAVDDIFKLGMAHPMGPLALADFIGLDVCLNIMDVLQSGFGDPKFRPCPLLKQMVAAGKLGKKSGEGFFKYAAS